LQLLLLLLLILLLLHRQPQCQTATQMTQEVASDKNWNTAMGLR